MIKLYTNENSPFPSVQALRKLGYDVLTTQDTGLAGKAISDIDVLKYAIKQKRVLISLNRKHFIHLHSKIPEHYGIIVCTFDPDFLSWKDAKDRSRRSFTSNGLWDSSRLRVIEKLI